MSQVKGSHWQDLGCTSVKRFVMQMQKNEGEHLAAFVKCIQLNNSAKFLRSKDWAGFARRYTGPGLSGK